MPGYPLQRARSRLANALLELHISSFDAAFEFSKTLDFIDKIGNISKSNI
jgi:hypothetical protein